MKKRIITLLAIILFVFTLTGCNKGKTYEAKDIPIERETKFNSCYIKLTNEEFLNLGFEYGDSVDIYFSNGKKLYDVPFYSGYYTRFGEPLILYYQGYPYISVTYNYGSSFFDDLELNDQVTATIKLFSKGKYLTYQNTFSLSYSSDITEYPSNEAFGNFRPMNLSSMKEDLFYRGASPFNNVYKRADVVSELLKKNKINFILDLADSQADIDSYKADANYKSEYATSLLDNDKAVLLNMGANYTSDEFKKSLGEGLTKLIYSEGPYYIHCTEGKDRTGFVCCLLECLANASYEEMKEDYMITYFNYYKIDKSSEKYEAVVELNFDAFMENITHRQYFDKNAITYIQDAINYLEECGMYLSDINKLVSLLQK